MTRNFVIIIALGAVALVIASVSLKVFNPSLLSNLSSLSKQTPSSKTSTYNQQVKPTQTESKPTSNNQQDLEFPYRLENTAVKSAQVTYVLIGNVETVEPRTGETVAVLIANIKESGKTKFFITKDTKIVSSRKDVENSANISDLKSNQKIYITAIYNLKTKKWNTDKVAIVTEN